MPADPIAPWPLVKRGDKIFPVRHRRPDHLARDG